MNTEAFQKAAQEGSKLAKTAGCRLKALRRLKRRRTWRPRTLCEWICPRATSDLPLRISGNPDRSPPEAVVKKLGCWSRTDDPTKDQQPTSSLPVQIHYSDLVHSAAR